MTLRFAACVLLLMAFSLPAMPIAGAASDLLPAPVNDRSVAADVLPPGVHVDGLPQGSLEPLPPVDMSHWWAIPIRSHGSASDPAVAYGFLVLDFEDLHLETSDALARGLTLVPFSEFGSWTDVSIAAAAVPIGDALLFSRSGSALDGAQAGGDGVQPSGASAPASASMAMATSGPQMIVAVSYDTTADRGIANEALSQATSFYQDKHGIALNTLATWSYAGTISGYCELQKAAWQAQNQTVGAVAFVGFSNGVIGESSALSGGYGVYVGGDSATIYSRGESSNSCGGPPITPALLPQVFTSTGFPVNAYGGYAYAANALVEVPTWDADKRGTAYVLAHEFGHFLSMNHNMAHCWYDWWMPNHMHKTLESFTSQYTGDDRYDPPGSCADSVDRQHQNLEPDSHYHWYFNDQTGGGVAAVNTAWTRLSGCINARWCSADATPSAVRSLSASPGNARVTLSWTAPEFNGADAAGNLASIKGYCVYTSTSPNFLRDVSDGDCQDNAATSRTITTYREGGQSRSITNGVRHYFYVRAYNYNGGWTLGALGPKNSGYADTVPANRAPPAPGGPSPFDGQSGLGTSVTLSWGSSVDPDGDSVTYNVFLGTSHPPSQAPGCQSIPDWSRQCSVALQQGTQYHWGVQACDSAGACAATTDWHFGTQAPANNAPYTPGSPSPSNGATGVSTGTGLSWSGGDPDAGNTVTYTVYLNAGSGTPTTARCTNTSSTSCPNSSLGGLAAGTLYTWKVVATDNLGATSQSQWSFTTASANNAPYTPSSPSPSNGATGVSTGTGLSWSGGDPDVGNTVTYTVYLNAGSGTPTTARCTNTSLTSCPNSSLGGLAAGTLYTWKVVATDNLGATSQAQWSFTTASANNAPYTPNSPSPANGATGVAQTTGLSWSGGDPDAGNTVTYTVYLNAGSGTPTTARCTNTSSTSCPNSSLGGLSAGTLYTWKVVATDNLGATSQAQWSFTTNNHAPDTPSNPSPANGATGVSTGTGLSWSGGDEDLGDTVTYTAYLNAGSGTPTTARCTNTSSLSCPNSSLGGLAAGTLYTWKVVATDNHGATSQSQWSFTTASPNNAPYTPNSPSPSNGATGVAQTTGLSWSGGDPDAGNTVTYTVYLNAGSGTPTTARCTNTSSTSCPNSSLGGLAAGTLYTWKVVATDNLGATSQAQWSFTTAAAPQTPEVPDQPYTTTGVYSYVTGDPITFCSTGSADPQGDNIQYVFNWGDGTSVTASNTVPSNTQGCAQHTWSSTGSNICVKAYAQDLNSPASAYSVCRYVSVSTGPPACSGGPGNNCFSAAYSGSGTAWYPASQSTSGASTEPGEPLPCGSMGATVWYSWTPSVSGTYRISTDSSNSDYDTVLAVYSGQSLGSLSQLGCNDDYASPDRQSQLDLSLTAGVTYRVQVGGYQGATGTLLLDIWKL